MESGEVMSETWIRAETLRNIKTDIGYTETQSNCGNCGNHTEVADLHVDRSWNQVCLLFADLGMFKVELTATCRHWKETSPCA